MNYLHLAPRYFPESCIEFFSIIREDIDNSRWTAALARWHRRQSYRWRRPHLGKFTASIVDIAGGKFTAGVMEHKR
jgi:hypothetical protein